MSRPTTPPAPPNWSAGGYLGQVPVDPWGRPYVYRSPGESGPYDLMSLGADGSRAARGSMPTSAPGAAGEPARDRQAGLTLIEMLVVLVIIAVMAG